MAKREFALKKVYENYSAEGAYVWYDHFATAFQAAAELLEEEGADAADVNQVIDQAKALRELAERYQLQLQDQKSAQELVAYASVELESNGADVTIGELDEVLEHPYHLGQRFAFATEEMTCDEFVEGYMLDDRDFDSLIDEMLRIDGGPSSEKMFNFMKDLAKEEGVRLTDIEDFDYDDYFYEVYKNTEKGLS
jgi:hypothetical protein